MGRHYCFMCRTEQDRDFSLYQKTLLCDDCYHILDGYYKEALKECLEERGTFDEGSFLEALDEFISYKSDEYNENIRKERMEKWQK